MATTVVVNPDRAGELSIIIENRSDAPVESPLYLLLQSRQPDASDWTTVGYVPFSGAGAVTKICVDLTSCEFAASYSEIPAGETEVWRLPRSDLPADTYRLLIRDIEPDAQDANEFQLS